MRLRRPAFAVLALLAAGCAPTAIPPPGSPPGRAETPAQNLPPSPPPAPRSSIPRPQVSVKDQCGAAELQGLIGHSRAEIPVPVDPSRQRVACTTCPVTLDFNPDRLNFFFDADTGLIREIRCG